MGISNETIIKKYNNLKNNNLGVYLSPDTRRFNSSHKNSSLFNFQTEATTELFQKRTFGIENEINMFFQEFDIKMKIFRYCCDITRLKIQKAKSLNYKKG